MKTAIKNGDTIMKRMNSGEFTWVMLPARTFGSLPIGLVDHLASRGLIRVPTKSDLAAFDVPSNAEKKT